MFGDCVRYDCCCGGGEDYLEDLECECLIGVVDV